MVIEGKAVYKVFLYIYFQVEIEVSPKRLKKKIKGESGWGNTNQSFCFSYCGATQDNNIYII